MVRRYEDRAFTTIDYGFSRIKPTVLPGDFESADLAGHGTQRRSHGDYGRTVRIIDLGDTRRFGFQPAQAVCLFERRRRKPVADLTFARRMYANGIAYIRRRKAVLGSCFNARSCASTSSGRDKAFSFPRP